MDKLSGLIQTAIKTVQTYFVRNKELVEKVSGSATEGAASNVAGVVDGLRMVADIAECVTIVGCFCQAMGRVVIMVDLGSEIRLGVTQLPRT